MKTVTEQLNFRVTPALGTIFAALAKLETGGDRIELLKIIIRRAAREVVDQAIKAGALPDGTGCEFFLTGREFDAAYANALRVLESKMAKAGDGNDVQA